MKIEGASTLHKATLSLIASAILVKKLFIIGNHFPMKSFLKSIFGLRKINKAFLLLVSLN